MRPLVVKSSSISVCLLVTVSATLFGCGGSADTAATSSPPPSAEAVQPASLSVELRTEPVAGAQGAFRVVLLVADGDGGGPGYVIDFGDGERESRQLVQRLCPAEPSSASTVSPLDETLVFEHVYKTPGNYEVTASVSSETDCGQGGPETAKAEGRVEYAA